MQFLYNFTRLNTDEVNTNVGTNYTGDLNWTVDKYPSKSTQTDYRDSEAQTVPWEPPYKLSLGGKCEVLALTELTWDNGLPIGKHEIKLVERLRIKNVWESLLPPLDSNLNVKTHNAIISMIDKEEWASRDKELQLLMDIRLESMEKIMKIREVNRKKELVERLDQIEKYLNQIRNKEVDQIRRTYSRELRKLDSKRRNGWHPN